MWVESIDQDRSVCVRWRSAEGHSLKVQLLSARLLFLLTHTFVLNLVFIDTDCKMICAVMNSWTSCRRLREREKWIIVEMKGWTVLRRGGGWRWRKRKETRRSDGVTLIQHQFGQFGESCVELKMSPEQLKLTTCCYLICYLLIVI